MKKATGTRAYSRAAKRFRRVQAARLKLAPRAPITDLRGAVENKLDAGQGAGARRSVRQIPAHDFNAQSIEKLGPAPRARSART